MSEDIGVYFLDVGQGDASVVVLPDRSSAIVFDCKDQFVTERFLLDHGIEHLRAVVVSHLDKDHIGGVLPLMRSLLDRGIPIDQLFVRQDRGSTSVGDAARALIHQAIAWDEAGDVHLAEPYREAKPRDIAEGESWRVSVVLPYLRTLTAMRLDDAEEPNPCSSVLRIEAGPTVVLIGGDAPLSSWSELDRDAKRAEVIRIPHHGGEIRENNEPWSAVDGLYEEFGATTGVISVGTQNRYGHPVPEHLAAVRRSGGCRVLCTQLTPRCHDAPEGRRAEAVGQLGEVAYPYRHRVPAGEPQRARPRAEVPCAGSAMVRLTLDGECTVAPSAGGWHGDFVTTLGSPLCQI